MHRHFRQPLRMCLLQKIEHTCWALNPHKFLPFPTLRDIFNPNPRDDTGVQGYMTLFAQQFTISYSM